MSDPVNPTHYGEGAYEAIKVIEAWGLGFCLGNAVKYICRAGKKHPDRLEDLRKAAWYLQREIEQLTPRNEMTMAQRAAEKEKEYSFNRPEAILNIPVGMSPPPPPLRPVYKATLSEQVLKRFDELKASKEALHERVGAVESEMARRRPFGTGNLNERISLLETNEINIASRLEKVEKAVEPLPAIVKWFRAWNIE